MGARVVTSGGSTISCVIRNHSAGGALLRFAGPQMLPTAFDMIVDKHDAAAKAEVTWRRGEFAGVAFRERGAMEALATVAELRDDARRQRSRVDKLARDTGY
jgi:hypothetical protein